jgi:hypothetical protein
MNGPALSASMPEMARATKRRGVRTRLDVKQAKLRSKLNEGDRAILAKVQYYLLFVVVMAICSQHAARRLIVGKMDGGFRLKCASGIG